MTVRSFHIPDKCDYCHSKPVAFIRESGFAYILYRWVCDKHLEMVSRCVSLKDIGKMG